MRDVVLTRCADRRALAHVIDRAVSLLEADAGEAADIDVWRNRRSGLALVQCHRRGAVERLRLHASRHEAFTYSGFVAAARFDPAEVRQLISFERRPVMTASPGGIATYFLADARNRRLAAWSSHAGLEGPYVTDCDGCTVISNRPLLSHLVGRQIDRPVFSARWARRILLAGASLWGDTPFEGTAQALPRSAVVAGDKVESLPHPVALSGGHRARDPAGVEALCAAGLEAVAPLRRWPRAELWLSGGKDSRMAAALLRRAGIDVDVITHARVNAGEGEAAAAVARALGLEHRITDAAGIATGDELLPVVLGNLRRSDGLVAEARQLAYRPPPGVQPVVQGQAHHVRGGYRCAVLPGADLRARLISDTVGDVELVVEPLVEERRSRLEEILDGYQVRHPREAAYWLYSDWRMIRSAAYRPAARSRPVVWPMMDERALQDIAALAPVDRVREVAFFDALCRLAPELASVPLYQDVWRVDVGSIGKTEWPDGYEARRTPFREKGAGRTPERRVATIQPLFRQAMRDLGPGRELASLVRPGVLETLCDDPDPALALDRAHMQIINFMWKATAVALVMEGRWLTAPT